MLYSSILGLIALLLAASGREKDERTIRSMVDQAISRLNKGDVAAFEEYWDEHADYVGVDGKLTKGRVQIEALFREMAKAGVGQQTTVDGSWIVAGARDRERAGNCLRSKAGLRTCSEEWRTVAVDRDA